MKANAQAYATRSVTRKGFFRRVLGLAALSLSFSQQAFSAESARPNLVYIYTDDQPSRGLNCNDPYFHTPNMDRLRREGVMFPNAFVTTSICAVSRASMFTGQHMIRHGINSFDTPLSPEQLRLSYSGVLRAAGYRTAFLGKFAIGHPRSASRESCLPTNQFDLFYGFTQDIRYTQQVNGQKRYLTSVMEEKAIAFMRDNPKDKPFLLILALPEPHGVWDYRDPDFQLASPPGPPSRPRTMTREALARLPRAIRESRNDESFQSLEAGYRKYMETVRDYIARTDLAVGRIVEALRDLKVDDHTVVIFTSDNGSMWGAHGLAGKWNMYEESIRVPLIIRDPRLPASALGTRDQMALNIDIAPTMLALAGLPVPAGMQGMDLTPILREPGSKGRADWYYEHDVGTKSQGKPLPRCEGVRTEQWKYIRYKDTQPVQEELFDLKVDPGEEQNLAADPAQAQRLASLRARCAELRAALK